MPSASSPKQPFAAHLAEARNRLLWVISALIGGTIGGYLLHEPLSTILIQPLDQKLYYSSPAGAFEFTLKVSLFFGVLVTIPIFMFHCLRFIEPALPRHSMARTLQLLALSCLLMVLGAAFAYLVSLPAALHFLTQFGSERVESLISTNDYFSFVSRYVLAFGLLFQLPLVMLVVNSIARIDAKTLFRHQRWVILLSFIAGAILTPTPDVFNQALLAVPIILLYQATAGMIWVINARARRKTDQQRNENSA